MFRDKIARVALLAFPAASSSAPLSLSEKTTVEELGVDISKDNIKYIKNISLGIPLCDIYYLKKDIDLSKLKLQSSEVSSVSFLKRETIEELIKNNTFHKTHAKVFNEVISYIDNIDI